MDFNVTAESHKPTLSFFSIEKVEDFIQKDVYIKDMVIEDGIYGKQLKVTIMKDDAEMFTWMCAEPIEDKILPDGKILTREKQINNVIKTVTHIGGRFLGETWTTTGVKSYEELLTVLIKETKSLWATTKLNVKLEFNKKGFTAITKIIPFLENTNKGEKLLTIKKKDEDSLIKHLSIKPSLEAPEVADDELFKQNSVAPTDIF
jgi:hypothetical protein